MMRTFCAAATTAAATGLYGRMPGVALEDYVHSKLIVIWGCNPSATSGRPGRSTPSSTAG